MLSIWKKVGQIITVLLLITLAVGCGKSKESNNVVRVGTISGPETQIMNVAAQVARKQYGLDVQIVPFDDYTMPNEALADGSIDANAFQHLPYLQAAVKAKGYQLTPIAKTFLYPMAFYSEKIKKISDLKEGAIIAISSDPSNQARALLILQKANLIQLKTGVDSDATTLDIIKNPKHLVIKTMDPAQLPRALPDVALAAINTNYAMIIGLTPSKDGILEETPDSIYANLIVVRTNDKDNPKFQKLVDAFQSPEVIAEAEKLFKGQAIPAWKSQEKNNN